MEQICTTFTQTSFVRKNITKNIKSLCATGIPILKYSMNKEKKRQKDRFEKKKIHISVELVVELKCPAG